MDIAPEGQVYDLSTRSGWQAWAARDELIQPERKSARVLGAMACSARHAYAQQRMTWHAQMPPMKTGPLTATFKELELQLRANTGLAAGDPRPGVLINAAPAVGKSTILRAFGREVERTLRAGVSDGLYPSPVSVPHAWIPVVHVSLRADTTVKGFSGQLVGFYGAMGPAQAKHVAGGVPPEMILPGNTKDSWTDVLATLTRCCATQLVLVDDVHFLRMTRQAHLDVNDHLKSLMNELPVTFVFAGVDCAQDGFLSEGLAGPRQANSQLRSRVSVQHIDPFVVKAETGRRNWLALLAKIEARIVLARCPPDSRYLREHEDYLYEVSDGRIGPLMNLVRQAAAKAIAEETELIDDKVLRSVRIAEDVDSPSGAKQARTRRENRTTTGPKKRGGRRASGAKAEPSAV